MCLRIPVWCVVQSQTFLLTPEQQKMFIIESRARMSLYLSLSKTVSRTEIRVNAFQSMEYVSLYRRRCSVDASLSDFYSDEVVECGEIGSVFRVFRVSQNRKGAWGRNKGGETRFPRATYKLNTCIFTQTHAYITLFSFYFSLSIFLFYARGQAPSAAAAFATPNKFNNVWLDFIFWTNFSCKPLSKVRLLDAKTPRLLT